MFSVVIPLYNKENQIKKTLESVLNQTFKDFEVVIVNDGSKDRSVEVVESFKDDRIRIITQENAGVSAARNRGIQEANNEWIAFLDADDLWKVDKLEIFAEVITKYPDVPWVLSGYVSIKGNKKYNYIYNYLGQFEDGLDDLNKGLSIQTSTVVVPKKYFLEDKALFFKVGLNHSEDREVWYKLLFRFKNPYYIKEGLTHYIIDTDGNSLNTSMKDNFSFISLKERLNEEIKLLELNRQKKIIKFFKNYNRLTLWNRWITIGWDNRFLDLLGKTDIFIMKIFNKSPIIVKKCVSRIISKYIENHL